MQKSILSILFLFICSMTQAGNPLLGTFSTPHGAAPFDKIKATDYEPAFDEAMKRHNAEIKKITDNKAAPTFQNTIETLEYSGELLEKVSQIFFNILSAESSDEIMKISQSVQPKLTAHYNDINLNEKLFIRIKAVHEQKDKLGLNTEQMRLLEHTYDGFVDQGANLNPQDKEKYRELSSKLSSLTLNFGQNVLKATNAYNMELAENQLAGLPESVREAAEQKARAKGKEGWVVDLSAPSYVAFMKYSANRELRKQLYAAYTTRCTSGEFDNMDNIRQIVNTRLELAKLMGYNCYADHVLKKRMAGTTTEVYKLLNDLLNGYKPAALQEYREVQGYAIGKEGSYIEVMPYDWSYYADKLKDTRYGLNDEIVRPYFELENVKKGIFGLATDLYGITFKLNREIPVYNPEVIPYEVFDKDGKFLAILYVDVFPREGKRPGAWMTEFKGQKIYGGENIRPHISIVMNFTRPTATKPALLTYDEVNTFLHEFGHALHGMFANTVYPGFSGTSVFRDFVELPSQIMENFLLEKEFLDKIAIHYQTGEKIPTELVQKIMNASNFNVGYTCLRQLSFGILDMAYHVQTVLFENEVNSFENQAITQTQVLPFVEGSLISPTFSHIFSGGYAAGYYSYKWAEVLDADAFALFKEKGIFNREVAQRFRDNILSRGGTEDPMELYVRFRGQKPQVDALLKRDGIRR